jgi:hypothetical protein
MSRSSLLTKLAFRLPYTFLRLPSLYNIVWNFASHSNTFPFCFLQIRWNCSGDFAFSLNTTSNAIFVKARELLPPAMNQNLDWMKTKIFAKCFCKEAKIVSSQLWCLRKLKTFPRLSSSIFSCQQFLAISSPFQRRLPSNICIYLVFAIGSVFDSILVSWCQMSASPCNLLTSPIQHRFPQLLRLRSPILTRAFNTIFITFFITDMSHSDQIAGMSHADHLLQHQLGFVIPLSFLAPSQGLLSKLMPNYKNTATSF